MWMFLIILLRISLLRNLRLESFKFVYLKTIIWRWNLLQNYVTFLPYFFYEFVNAIFKVSLFFEDFIKKILSLTNNREKIPKLFYYILGLYKFHHLLLKKGKPGNTEQGKCRLTNEYLFFLFFIGCWYYEKNILSL